MQSHPHLDDADSVRDPISPIADNTADNREHTADADAPNPKPGVAWGRSPRAPAARPAERTRQRRRATDASSSTGAGFPEGVTLGASRVLP